MESHNQKLLVITQKVDKNDSNLGFFHRWLEEFSLHFDSVITICLEEGTHDLPENVKVLSLGKEEGISRFKYLWNFYKFIWRQRDQYDSVFVHMNPIYVVLGGLLWRLLGKYIGLWYTHKSVTWKLRIAEKLSHIIFTASKESFRLSSEKVIATGHGIDADLFKPAVKTSLGSDDAFTIASISRIAPVKKIDSIIRSVRDLRDQGKNVELRIVGGSIDDEGEAYLRDLENQVIENNLQETVTFVGAVTQSEVVDEYNRADLFVNLSDTGSLDKAVLEALLTETLVLTSNEAFQSITPDSMFLPNDDPEIIQERVMNIMNNRKSIQKGLQRTVSKVKEGHSLDSLISYITAKIAHTSS